MWIKTSDQEKNKISLFIFKNKTHVAWLTDRQRYRPLWPVMVVGRIARYRPHQVCSVYTFGIWNYKLTLIHIRPNFVLSGRRRALLSFSVYRSEIEKRAAKLRFFENVAFNFLSKLVNRPENIGEDDEGSPVDDVDEEIGEESDVECDGEEDNEISIDLDSDLDLNSSDDDDGVEAQGDAGFAWSEQLLNVQIDLFTAHKGPKLEDLNIDYTSDPYDFLSFSLQTLW